MARLMGLIDDLRAVAAVLDPSLGASSNETGPLLGALIAYTEHGDKVVKAAQDEDNPAGAVSELLSPAAEDADGKSSGSSSGGSSGSSSGKAK